ncbi:MAG: TetR/AcrR family transcriptional regulator C-terminal domain-containing protein [Pseudolysinimonas sp.]|uniref:TetR/AcrR family transcriptional regulator C-terminal domain-containing protein n=1 Tax=Pseudolysinimonas sp. TaxID=2680009 RepID=UPI0032678A8F
MSPIPNPPLTRASIESAALDLLDEVGLDALSTRRLADALGVQSPAIYWHFRNKAELLEGMAERIYLAGGTGAPLPDEPWRAWITRRAREYRKALTSRRDGARVAAEVNAGSPALFRLFDDEITAMVGFGFTPGLAMHTISVITHFISGFVLKEQSASGQTPPAAALEPSAILEAAFEQGGGPVDPEVFEHGIRMIIAGVAVELAELRLRPSVA